MRKIGEPWTMERKDEIYRRPMDMAGPRDRAMMTARFIAGVGESVLDLACGAGQLANMVDGKCYLGIDHSPAQLQRAWAMCKNPSAWFLQMDITKLLDEDVGQFDCVVCDDILEHLADPHAMAQFALCHAEMRVIITLPVSMGGYDHVWVDFSREDVEETIFGKPAWLLEKYRYAVRPRSVRWIGVWRV